MLHGGWHRVYCLLAVCASDELCMTRLERQCTKVCRTCLLRSLATSDPPALPIRAGYHITVGMAPAFLTCVLRAANTFSCPRAWRVPMLLSGILDLGIPVRAPNYA